MESLKNLYLGTEGVEVTLWAKRVKGIKTLEFDHFSQGYESKAQKSKSMPLLFLSVVFLLKPIDECRIN